jgi:hypothetical protein
MMIVSNSLEGSKLNDESENFFEVMLYPEKKTKSTSITESAFCFVGPPGLEPGTT